MIRKNSTYFPKLFKGNYGQGAANFIVLEFKLGWAYPRAHSDREISFFHLTNVFGNVGSKEMAKEYNLMAF